MKRILGGITIGILLISFLALSGCSTDTSGGKQGKSFDYTVVKEDDIPEIFKKQIDENKINPFQLSYLDGEYLYIAVGYGEQASGGYSIQVKELCEQGEDIRFLTELIGPNDEQVVKKLPTTPHIVVKMEAMDKMVVYE